VEKALPVTSTFARRRGQLVVPHREVAVEEVEVVVALAEVAREILSIRATTWCR
jgi:hypothetical protein